MKYSFTGDGSQGLTRVNSANILDEGLRIRGRGRQMNLKVKVQSNKAKLYVCRE
jgi:hypothetical protein